MVILLLIAFGTQPSFIFGQATQSKPESKPDVKSESPASEKITTTPVAREAPWWPQRHEAKLKAKKKMGQVDLLMIGDSITQSWEGRGKGVWKKYYSARKPLNIGFSGDRTEHVIWRLQNGEMDDITPKLAVVMIGTNNTGHRMDAAEDTAAGVKEVLNEVKKRSPKTKILLVGVFPRGQKPADEKRVRNEELNKIIKTYADEKQIWYLDVADKFLDEDGVLPKELMPDFLHPNRKGYQIWAAAMEPMIKKLME